MPGRSQYHSTLSAAFRRWPWLEALGLGLLDRAYMAALLPFRRRRLPGSPREQALLVERTDEYNRAAERYFAGYGDTSYLLDKPFSDPAGCARHLIDAGVLIDAMELFPGDTVLELGAGSCWLSHMLNRFGCPTVAVDVSPTALALGRQLFDRDPRTRWDLEPRFVPYDGHRLPLADGSCDRVVVNDAFHHLPNQAELLREMHRVLRAEGVVAMSEPGRGHGSASHSLIEAASTGVLENELVLEDVAALAEACGFDDVSIVVAAPAVRQRIPARDLGAFMGGRGFASYWKTLCSGLEQHHYIVCRKGRGLATSRRPRRLSARIAIAGGPTAIAVRRGQPATVMLDITNTGDTTWLAAENGGGWTRVGARLFHGPEGAEPLALDWARAPLPADVAPAGQVRITLTLPPLDVAGAYVVAFDLVVEGLAWFGDRGSSPATMRLDVTSSTAPRAG